MNNCPLCRECAPQTIYEVRCMPVFQNKVYDTEEDAKKAVTGDVVLVQCQYCGFVLNGEFNDELMRYDENYQNEQTHSHYFQSYLREIIELLKSKGLLSGKIIEIGSGKGFFIDRLLQNGVDAIGFDPAYEGDNPRIIKDYFGDSYQAINADLVILRHTLEHIKKPLDFLHTIAKSNSYKGKIFIEVPCFDWIRGKNAFWDIYYEHCNYFTTQTLRSMFTASHAGKLFRDQYLYLIADFRDMKPYVTRDGKPVILTDSLFAQGFDRYRQFVAMNKYLMVWGAGAKGATFVNLVDSDRVFIRGLIDINPKKQNRYIPKTAHKIYGTEALRSEKVRTILVMNENYLNEITNTVSNPDITLYALGLL